MSVVTVDLYFSEYFDVHPQVVMDYGALDISVVTDLPLFIDPFLLFNSDNPAYQDLHQQIIDYLVFLRDEARPDLDDGALEALYCFKEVKQNWLGVSRFGNSGSGLGMKFARALNSAMVTIFTDFGDEQLTRSSHLEKVTLIGSGVGQDNLSDFTTNLIKDYLCEYTQTFASTHLATDRCATFRVPRAKFNATTKTWADVAYTLPRLGDDFVLLTPVNMLAYDKPWINRASMVRSLPRIAPAVSNAEQKAKINRYMRTVLARTDSAKEHALLAQKLFEDFPELIDLYIKLQEDRGDKAASVSAKQRERIEAQFIEQIRQAITALRSDATFASQDWASYAECRKRVALFKTWIEDQEGYRVFNPKGKRPVSKERELQITFGLAWAGSALDANREVNNGRGPVDFKASMGSGDKSLIEFKLGSNSQLEHGLEKQVEVYEKANGTRSSMKVIICFTRGDMMRTEKILKKLGLDTEEAVVVIDARNDNKPSASNA